MRIEPSALGSRRFLFVSHRTPPDGSFSLNDLPGSGGRVDVLARCVTSSLLLSNAIRRDASVSIFFASAGPEGKAVIVSGSRVRYLNPDERSTAALIRNALVQARKSGEGEASPGIFYVKGTLREVVGILSESCPVYYLREDGRNEAVLRLPALFVIGDSWDLTGAEEEMVMEQKPETVSISKVSQQSDQCAVIVNWLLDNTQPKEG